MTGSKNYYVYALMDPRGAQSRPFYIGKGHGSRKNQHLSSPDESVKWRTIQAIRNDGMEPLVTELIPDLTESQALLLEAQLIGAFGAAESGGFLTNQVLTSGRGGSRAAALTMPWGVVERAQIGLSLLKQSVVDLVVANPQGVSNADVASSLGLRSDHMGASKDYLSYSLIGLLLKEHQVRKVGRKYLHINSEEKP